MTTEGTNDSTGPEDARLARERTKAELVGMTRGTAEYTRARAEEVRSVVSISPRFPATRRDHVSRNGRRCARRHGSVG